MIYYARRKQQLERYIKILEREIGIAPEGSLSCQKSSNGFRYYQITGTGKSRKRKYIPLTQRKLAIELARKRLNEALLEDCQRELEALTRFEEKYGEKPGKSEILLEKSEGVRNLILEYCRQWEVKNEPKTHYHPEGLKNEAPEGHKTRSKGEADIWWDLYDELLPVIYEKQLWFDDTPVLPDFIIKHPITGEEIIWEHFGMMDNPDYARRAYQKISLYIQYGYFPGWNLIVTFEDKDHPLSRRRIQAEIQYYFGDWINANGHRKK